MNQKRVRFMRAFWWALFAAWLVLTVYLSSQNGSDSSDVSGWLANKLWRASNLLAETLLNREISFATFHFYVRKVAHFTVHMILAFITIRASLWSFPKRKDAVEFAWIFSISLAMFDEIIQLFAPGRSSVLFDAMINLSGVIIGAFISSLFGPNKEQEHLKNS